MSHWITTLQGLQRTFNFSTHTELAFFVCMISEIAEEMDHHPTYQFIGETDLSIELITHDEKKITEKDVELARKINQCFKAYKKN